jgi:TolB-like protein
MAEFFAELKRRHMFRVAAAYVVVAWLILQVVNNIAPGLNLPNWVLTLVIVLLAGGFPIALIFAWIHQLSPADASAPSTTATRLDYTLIGALVLVIALVSYQQLAPSSGTTTPQAKQADVSSLTAPSPTGISIAVLPLANLSGDASQEFFSDGMTDEITTALTKIPNLRVVGRTSAFQFKGQNRNVQAISQGLQARYVIDGSVRRVGDRVRVTAQLIQADTGVNLWADNYDRELTDVFAIQEEIALAIASALRVPLGLRQGESLIPSRATNLDSYQDYLRAKALVRSRGRPEPGGPLTEATQLLEQVIARDPQYAPAWVLLGQAYALIPVLSPVSFNGSTDELRRAVEASFPKAEAAAERAIRLDPNSADGYAALAYVRYFHGRFVEGEDLSKQALSLDPTNPEALNVYSVLLLTAGRMREALPLRQRLRALEPFVPIWNALTVHALWLNGQTEAAFAILETLPPGVWGVHHIYASEGRYREAADVLSKMPPGLYQDQIRDTAVRLLRTAPARAPSPQTLPRLGELSFVFLYVGAADRALESLESDVSAGLFTSTYNPWIWHRSAAALRKTDRFKAYIRKAGLLDYWRARGWPDLCRPAGADDFVCD